MQELDIITVATLLMQELGVQVKCYLPQHLYCTCLSVGNVIAIVILCNSFWQFQLTAQRVRSG